MKSPALRALAAAWACPLLVVATAAFAPVASAAVVTYTINGSFNGNNGGDAELLGAIAPLLGSGSVQWVLSIDTATAGASAGASGGTRYRGAVTSSRASFAGFSSAGRDCPGSPEDFVCTVRVKDGDGFFGIGGTGLDSVDLFGNLDRSAGFEAATALGRLLTFEFELFFNDTTGAALNSEALTLDLTTLEPSKMLGAFSVFAQAQQGGGFARADFDWQVTGIQAGAPATPTTPGAVPEPGALPLAALALALAALPRRRRR